MKTIFIVAAGCLSLAQISSAQDEENSEVWAHYASRYDQDKNGEVTAAEYSRGDDRFTRLDRNQDGKLTPEDFARRGRGGRGRSPRNRKNSLKRLFTRYVDGDENKSITAAEWKAFVVKSDADGDGVVESEELTDAGVARMASRFVIDILDADDDDELTVIELRAALAELDENKDGNLEEKEFWTRPRGRNGRGERNRGTGISLEEGVPRVREQAPDFKLPALGSDKTVHLASFTGKKPVALIFGSYT